MNLASPQLLWLLALLPLLIALFLWNERRRRRWMELFIHSRLLDQLTSGLSPVRRRLRLGLLLAAVATLILAAARPRWGATTEEARSEGLDIVVAIDTSRSMLAEDTRPSRLERAKLATLELMQLARGDRFALVPFAGSAFLQCPLTFDAEVLRQNVNALDVGMIPTGGSSLAEAIRTTLTAFVDGDQAHKVLVLISDGEEHEPAALAATEAAAREGLRIFTLGVGSAEGELLRVPGGGSTEYLRDENGRIVKSRLNETLLRQIAGAAQGFYLPLASGNAIDILHQNGLAPLPKKMGETAQLHRLKEQYRWPLALGLLLLLMEIFLPEARREGSNGSMSRTKSLATLAAMLLAFGFAGPEQASPKDALRDYEAGRFNEAQRQFEQLAQARASKPDAAGKSKLEHNAGAAAFQGGDFSSAARHFGEALKAPDLTLQQRAFYNLGNSFYRLGEHASNPQQKIQMWEQSLRQYDGALKLDKTDADAAFNRDFVHKKLDLLKKQQPPPPPKADDKKGSTNPKQQPKNGKGQQDEKDSNGGSQSKDDKQKKSKQGNQKATEPQEGGDDRTDAADQPDEAPQMSPRQAQQLLDAQRGEEKALIHRPGGGNARDRKPGKDW